MTYRYDVSYWTYEQALELPFGLPCCRSNGVSTISRAEAHTIGRGIGWAGVGKDEMGDQYNLTDEQEQVASRIERRTFGPAPKCVECGRVFDLSDETDAEEWTYGHDCEG